MSASVTHRKSVHDRAAFYFIILASSLWFVEEVVNQSTHTGKLGILTPLPPYIPVNLGYRTANNFWGNKNGTTFSEDVRSWRRVFMLWMRTICTARIGTDSLPALYSHCIQTHKSYILPDMLGRKWHCAQQIAFHLGEPRHLEKMFPLSTQATWKPWRPLGLHTDKRRGAVRK